jgi:hypothetical protein
VNSPTIGVNPNLPCIKKRILVFLFLKNFKKVAFYVPKKFKFIFLFEFYYNCQNRTVFLTATTAVDSINT